MKYTSGRVAGAKHFRWRTLEANKNQKHALVAALRKCCSMKKAVLSYPSRHVKQGKHHRACVPRRQRSVTAVELDQLVFFTSRHRRTKEPRNRQKETEIVQDSK